MTPFFANVGVPMIFPQVVLMAIALLPVICFEAGIVRKPMAIKFRRALLDVVIANVCTTLIGVPLAWGLMMGLHLITMGGYALGLDTPTKMLAAVTLQAAWLVPQEEHLFWMIPAAATVLLIPSFVASVLIEHWVLARRWVTQERRAVFDAVLRANVWSYVALFFAGVAWFMSAAN